MPRPPARPPSFEDLIDQLTGYAMDYVEDTMGAMADRLKAKAGQFTPQQLPTRRVKGSGNGRKGPGTRQRGGQGPKQPPQASTRPRASVRTAYTVLGVIPGSDLALIKAAYRVMAEKYHPDRCSDPRAKEKMQEVNAAWEILKDPQKREMYDKELGL